MNLNQLRIRNLLLSLLVNSSITFCSVLDYSEESLPSTTRAQNSNYYNNSNLTTPFYITSTSSAPPIQTSKPAPATSASQPDVPQNASTNAHNVHQQTMNKLQKYLNYQQSQLIEANPGSLLAVAKAIKMTIVECQYQMRHDFWDCPVNGFGVKSTDIFGLLMSRKIREAAFVNSLLSAAIMHSVTRACTEGMISTCSRNPSRDGGFSENDKFGREFTVDFMMATHGIAPTYSNLVDSSNMVDGGSISASAGDGSLQTTWLNLNGNNIDANLNNNLIGLGRGAEKNSMLQTNQFAKKQRTYSKRSNSPQEAHASSSSLNESTKNQKFVRMFIDAHNEENGRRRVVSGMRRECKCHGLSGSCTMYTCWLKLPPFREVAQKLHDILDQAIKLVPAAKWLKSLTSTQLKASLPASSSSSSLRKSNKKRSSNSLPSSPQLTTPNSASTAAPSASPLKKRPVARSIGGSSVIREPTENDLIYLEDSPNFCEPNEMYNIKGTKGRICSVIQNAVNNCEKLCCGRGYKTEVRDEKYKCECQFKYCCKLECKTCSRRKVIHRCL